MKAKEFCMKKEKENTRVVLKTAKRVVKALCFSNTMINQSWQPRFMRVNGKMINIVVMEFNIMKMGNKKNFKANS